jgi:hypothetical protein
MSGVLSIDGIIWANYIHLFININILKVFNRIVWAVLLFRSRVYLRVRRLFRIVHFFFVLHPLIISVSSLLIFNIYLVLVWYYNLFLLNIVFHFNFLLIQDFVAVSFITFIDSTSEIYCGINSFVLGSQWFTFLRHG